MSSYQKPLDNLRLPIPSPCLLSLSSLSVPHHWWHCLMYRGFVPPDRSQVLLTPSQNSQPVEPEAKNQRPICPDLTKKERGHLLCCYRVLLPIVPECSGKIGISSFSGQHSSKWRWVSPSDPSLLRPHSDSHSRCPRPERDCVFKAPGAQSQHLSHYHLHPTNTCLLHSDHSDRKHERKGENHTSFCRWPQVEWNCV